MANERTFFGKSIRKSTTAEFYPFKLTLDQFVQNVLSKEHIDAYVSNMLNLGSPCTDSKYIEKWMEQFLAWSEIEQESEPLTPEQTSRLEEARKKIKDRINARKAK